jgi:hypothetical protein
MTSPDAPAAPSGGAIAADFPFHTPDDALAAALRAVAAMSGERLPELSTASDPRAIFAAVRDATLAAVTAAREEGRSLERAFASPRLPPATAHEALDLMQRLNGLLSSRI